MSVNPAYAKTQFFRDLVLVVARSYPSLDSEDLVQVLALDGRRYHWMALHGDQLHARMFSAKVLGIQVSSALAFVAEPRPELINHSMESYNDFIEVLLGPSWSAEDVEASMADGWLISQLEDGTEEIQRYDEDPKGRFDSDCDALSHVTSQAALNPSRDTLHSRAIRYLEFCENLLSEA